MSSYGIGTTYAIITSISVAVSLIAYILVPQDWGIRAGIRGAKAKVRSIYKKEQETDTPE